MATTVAISCTTLTTWTITVVSSSPVCQISPCNLPGLDEHGAATTSVVNLVALSDAAARDRTMIKDREVALLHSECALHTCSKQK